MINVSVIIPVYNSEPYIEETIKSVASQKLQNYEIIIVNDGCTDKSIEIANRVLADKKIPYRIINQENKGLSSARNAGVKTAVGTFVCFVDSDDIITQSHIMTMHMLAENNNLDIVCCEFESTKIENRYGIVSNKIKTRIISDDEFVEAVINRKPPIHICCMLLRRNFILSNNLYFNEKLRFGEDAEYFSRLLYTCKTVGLTTNNSYKYLNRPGSIMITITLEQGEIFLEEMRKACNRLENKAIYCRYVLGFIHAFARCNNFNEYKKIAKIIDKHLLHNTLKKSKQMKVKVFERLFWIHPSLAFIATKLLEKH